MPTVNDCSEQGKIVQVFEYQSKGIDFWQSGKVCQVYNTDLLQFFVRLKLNGAAWNF